MAKFVLTDASVVVNTNVDLSDHVKSVTVNYEAEIKDSTAMGSTARTKLPGLLNGSFEVEFFQDYDAANVDATLFAMVGAAASPFIIKPTSSAISATNPAYKGSCILASYTPLQGTVGDEATTKASFQVSGLIERDVTA